MRFRATSGFRFLHYSQDPRETLLPFGIYHGAFSAPLRGTNPVCLVARQWAVADGVQEIIICDLAEVLPIFHVGCKGQMRLNPTNLVHPMCHIGAFIIRIGFWGAIILHLS